MNNTRRKAIEAVSPKAVLRRLRKLLEMGPDSCSFTLPGHSLNPSMQDTKDIVEATRLWRDTWILPALDALIEETPGLEIFTR